MTDDFAALVLPIFQGVIELQGRLAAGETRTLDEVKGQIRSWIEAAEQRAVVDPALAENFELARYGLVAWVDEVFHDSAWGRSVNWGDRDQILEWDFYRTNNRAFKFWDMADSVENWPSLDPLETYLLCVALGFRGDRASDENKFRGWVQRVYEKVSGASPIASKPFTEAGDDPGRRGLDPLSGPALLLRVSILTAITAAVTLAGYLGSVHFAYTYDR